MEGSEWFNLGHPDVLELQFPEAFTTNCAGWDFWELQFKNTWVTQGWEPPMYG